MDEGIQPQRLLLYRLACLLSGNRGHDTWTQQGQGER